MLGVWAVGVRVREEGRMSTTDPATIMAEVTADCRSLDAVGRELGAKLKLLADAELAYGDAFDTKLLEADESSKERREAWARQHVDADLRGALTRLKREVDALQAYARIKGAVLSGRQSILSTLRDEARGGA